MEAYCVKCKAKKEMKSPKAVTMKNGKPATQGECPTCKTKMFRIGKAKQPHWFRAHRGKRFSISCPVFLSQSLPISTWKDTLIVRTLCTHLIFSNSH